MRIDAYNQVQQIYTNKTVRKTATAQKTYGATDNFQISSLGKELSIAKQAVNAAPDVRSEVVEPLKQSIKSGTYDVSSDKFADVLLSKFEAL